MLWLSLLVTRKVPNSENEFVLRNENPKFPTATLLEARDTTLISIYTKDLKPNHNVIFKGKNKSVIKVSGVISDEIEKIALNKTPNLAIITEETGHDSEGEPLINVSFHWKNTGSFGGIEGESD